MVKRRIVTRITRGVAYLIAIQVGVFVVAVFLDPASLGRLVDALVLTPAALANGHVWKLLSTTLVTLDVWTLVFDCLVLWLFLPALEDWWGTRRFLWFFVWTSLVGNTVGALVGLALAPEHALGGITPFVLASLVAYGVLWSDRVVNLWGVFPIKGRALAIGVAVLLALWVLFRAAWIEGAAFFSAMGLAWAMTKGVWTPNLWWLRYRRWRLRRRYKVIDGGKPNDKRWMN